MNLNRRSDVSLLAIILLGVAGASPSDAFGHEKGVLTAARGEVSAGASLEVSGRDLTPATTFRLVLQGALREYQLTEVRSDSAGALSLDLVIPETVEAGSYRLVTLAPDGDVTASVDISVLEAAPGAAPQPASEAVGDASQHAHAGSRGSEGGGQATPSAADLGLERSWSRVEWFVIGLLLGGALASGAALLRRPPAAT